MCRLMAWEGAQGRSVRADETVEWLRRAAQQREVEEGWFRAKALGLLVAVTVKCPQCGTVLEMPDDAIEAICGVCTACIGKDAYGWRVKG
jgi:hypothetical protein